MASETEVCNMAMQKLGAKAISDITDTESRNARVCAILFPQSVDAELEAHTWSFSIKRVQLAANATPPAFGKANAFQLPPDFKRLAPPDPSDNFNDRDWEIENGHILTDYPAPLNLRYVARVPVGQWPSVFVAVVSSRMARDGCEAITQSNTKKADAEKMYKEDLAEARRTNAIQKPPAVPYDDTFVSVRQ